MKKSPSENRISTKTKAKLEDFEIIGEIGSGAFSTVKLVIHKINKIKYALKILDIYHINMNDKIHYVKIEKTILNYLNADKVVGLKETFKDDKKLYFLLEYLPKGDLSKYISLRGKLDIEEVKFFVIEILNILIYLHSLGIIHRDLKPENLLLTNDFHLKIIDFGTAKFVPNENNKNLISMLKYSFNCLEENKDAVWRRKSLAGSLNYISPEVMNNEEFSFASDFWALGIITHKMLTNKFPLKDSDSDDFESSIVVNIDTSLDKDSFDFISRLLTYDPKKRMTDISEIISHNFISNIKEVYPKQLGLNNKLKLIPIGKNNIIFSGKFLIHKHKYLILKKLRFIEFYEDGKFKIYTPNSFNYDKTYNLTKKSKIELKNFVIKIENSKKETILIEPNDGNYIKYLNKIKDLLYGL